MAKVIKSQEIVTVCNIAIDNDTFWLTKFVFSKSVLILSISFQLIKVFCMKFLKKL